MNPTDSQEELKNSNSDNHEEKAKQLYADALEYHLKPRPGKLEVCITKSTESARDLSLAYSPGVAEPVRAIAADPQAAFNYTNKGNLVGVISDGSAILGLGNLGGLASKPVMEGKGVLFKRFAGIDVFDIEVETQDPLQFVQTV
ncbi:MAG TPA: malate dehydrogenase, partial [Gammaproteobacteria bacterium]|nr:malate dehydrogenase [Gammaproteobacteria bacterium]